MLTQSDLIFNQELAAWVQATGSVFAIFVAICIPLYLNHLEQKKISRLSDLEKKKYFVILFPSLYRVRRYSCDFLDGIMNHKDCAENILHTLDSEYLDLIPVFSKELHIFVHSQIYDEDLNQLAFEVFYCEEVLQQHLKLPQGEKQIIHQDKIIEHTEKVCYLCEKIIRKNESVYQNFQVPEVIHRP